MTRAQHNYELLYDAHICVTYLKRNDINTKINIKATSNNGLKTVLPFYTLGVFKVNKRIK